MAIAHPTSARAALHPNCAQPLPTPSRRGLLAAAGAVPLIIGVTAAGAPAVALPGPSAVRAAAAAYRAVQARHAAVNAIEADEDWPLVTAWCRDDQDAVGAIAEPPARDIADLLRKVAVLVSRPDRDGWNLTDAEEALVDSLQADLAALAPALLAEVAPDLLAELAEA